jgi:hypothetical protein
MTSEKIIQLLNALNVKNAKVSGGWVSGSCPLAPWKHKSGKDSNPSFGVHIEEFGTSAYSCFSCGSGSLEELVQGIEFYCAGNFEGYDFSTCHKLLNDEDVFLKLPEYGEAVSGPVFKEWPQYWIDSFSPALSSPVASDYLLNRGVSPSDMESLQLKYDPKRSMVVFPYWNVYGKFAGARGRSILPNVEGPQKHFDYTFHGTNNARLVWYGEQVLNLDGPVICCEGQFDWIKMQKAFPKSVANLTAMPSIVKMKKLVESGLVIQCADNDEAGERSLVAYKKMCSFLGLKYKRLILPPSVKDAAECSPAYLKDRIEELL